MSEKNEAGEKALDKMTVKELREVAVEIPEITGAHGMKKEELLGAIKAAKGIEDEKPKSAPRPGKPGGGDEIHVKRKIKLFKAERVDALANGDMKASKILRRRINRLKKKSRRVA